jgi:hypothetical protein
MSLVLSPRGNHYEHFSFDIMYICIFEKLFYEDKFQSTDIKNISWPEFTYLLSWRKPREEAKINYFSLLVSTTLQFMMFH